MTAFPSPSTPFPNHLIDAIMPELRDTEWRLLCVVVRQTLGWREGSGSRRKLRDWLSHGQIVRRTGRASAAVSKAVDALVRRGYVEVTDVSGGILLTPADRRRANGRLYYSIGPALTSKPLPERMGKEPETSKSVERSSQSGDSKARTTKAIGNKRLPYGRIEDVDKDVDSFVSRPQLPQADPDVRRVLFRYRELFTEKSVNHEPPPVYWARDGRRVRQLLALYPCNRVMELLERFFARDDEWIRRSGYSFGAFSAAIPVLLIHPQ